MATEDLDIDDGAAMPADAATPRDAILDAALALAAERRWDRVGLAEIALRAEVSLAELRREFPTRTAIVTGLMERTDDKVLADTDLVSDGQEPRRDRLFDLVMRRLDFMSPHKAAIRGMMRDVVRDPAGAICLGPRFLRSMAWMLEAAGTPTNGISGSVRKRVMAGVYLRTLRVWFDDQSEDSARTMSALDDYLRQASRFGIA